MADQFETLGQLLERNANLYSKNIAIVSGERRITYGELKSKVDKLAKGFLALGIKKADRVALLMDNRPEWIMVDFALGKIGAVLVPINIRYRENELNYILNHSGSSVLIMIDRFHETDFVDLLVGLYPEVSKLEKGMLELTKLPHLKYIFCLSDQKFPGIYSYEEILQRGEDVPLDQVISTQKNVNPQDIANILYTSGTTAFPKGVMLTHSNICKNGKNIAKRLHIDDKDKLWAPIPLFFSFGCITVLISGFAEAACIVLQQYFEPGEALRLIEKERCSVMFAMPTMYLPMIEHPYFKGCHLSSLRTGSIMGSSENIRKVIEEMGVAQINTGYGMTETSALCSLTDSDDPSEVRMNTAGRPFPGVTVVIKDYESGKLLPREEEGEICVKGYNVTQGYYNDPERTSAAFDEEGFLHSGDIGLITQEGHLKFMGRYKDMLKTSGINVSVLEVEHFLETHPDVKEAYVVGIPDKVKEEVGVAFVKLVVGSNCTETEIINYCKGKIASYKIPKRVRFVSVFPLTASGKVQKFKLRESALKESGFEN